MHEQGPSTPPFLYRLQHLLPLNKMQSSTCRTRPERGSITRSFLSLHVVVSRLPSVLKDMQRITSVWQSIIFTGSPMSRFQMRTCEGRHAGGPGPVLHPHQQTLAGAVCMRPGLCWDAGTLSRVLYREADASQLHTWMFMLSITLTGSQRQCSGHVGEGVFGPG